MKRVIVLLVLVVLTRSVFARDLVLSIHPFIQVDEVRAKFAPLASFLGKQLGVNTSIKVGADYDDHIRAIGRDQVDLAYMGPVSYVTLVKDYGKKPLLARMEMAGRPYFQGDIVVRKDSAYTRLGDLKGKPFAFGDPRSTMSYVVPHYMLVEAGVIDKANDNHAFLGSHENVALAVLAGDFAAGAVKPTVFKDYEARGLRVLATTPEISEHVFVARKGLPEDIVNKVRSVMLTIKQSEEGMAALKHIRPSATGLDAVKDSDYDNLRTIVDSLKRTH